MRNPVLVIMAAGMGSRFGGLKQIMPIDTEGRAIIDYSLFDAKRAGFKKVVFVIKNAIKDDFLSSVGKRAEAFFDEVSYVYQELNLLPEGYSVPEGREKPWGTGHAVLCCKEAVGNEPFAVINADDFYGRDGFEAIYRALSSMEDESEICMVGYELSNTLTENGSVSRGICNVGPDGKLTGVKEHLKIFRNSCGEGARSVFDDGEEALSGKETVSMNFWGLSPMVMDEFLKRFPSFLDSSLKTNPLKCEYFLPFVINDLISEGKVSVSVLPCNAKWLGLTYKEDLDTVVGAVASLRSEGEYEGF
ncbi:MAG: NTP transferase domain-containing protein [Oscillospiraceae bacterium]|nr:NTP transferase domain-containing protein [Oscillospiraceae bacterium]